jgi:hypothetical protein
MKDNSWGQGPQLATHKNIRQGPQLQWLFMKDNSWRQVPQERQQLGPQVWSYFTLRIGTHWFFCHMNNANSWGRNIDLHFTMQTVGGTQSLPASHTLQTVWDTIFDCRSHKASQ